MLFDIIIIIIMNAIIIIYCKCDHRNTRRIMQATWQDSCELNLPLDIVKRTHQGLEIINKASISG